MQIRLYILLEDLFLCKLSRTSSFMCCLHWCLFCWRLHTISYPHHCAYRVKTVELSPPTIMYLLRLIPYYHLFIIMCNLVYLPHCSLSSEAAFLSPFYLFFFWLKSSWSCLNWPEWVVYGYSLELSLSRSTSSQLVRD